MRNKFKRFDASIFPATINQAEQWFLGKKLNKEERCFTPSIYRIRGELNVSILERAFKEVISRHAIFRTSFFEDENGKLFQKTHEKNSFRIKTILKIGAKLNKESILRILRQGRDNSPQEFFQVTLVKVAKNDFYLVIIRHHIISDGESLSILHRELSEIYRSMLLKKSLPKETVKQYQAFALAKEREDYFGQAEYQYWQKKSFCINRLISDQVANKNKLKKSYKIITKTIRFSDQDFHELSIFSRQFGVSKFTVMFAVFCIALGKLSGEEELVVFIPISERKYVSNMKNSMGNFVNGSLAYIKVSKRDSVVDVVKRCRLELNRLKKYSRMPFSRVKRLLNVKAQVIEQVWPIVFTQEVASRSELSFDDAKVTTLFYGQPIATMADLLCELSANHSGAFKCEIRYDANRYSENQIASFISSYQDVFKATITHHEKVGEPLSLMEKFEKIVKKYPHAIAICDNEAKKKISYKALNDQVNKLAAYIQSLGVTQQDFIIIFLHASVGFVVAMLACIKSNVPYIPLDPALSGSRVDYIKRNSAAKYCIAANPLGGHENLCFIPLGSGHGVLKDFCAKHPAPDDLVYVIYTSGTTGEPKGVKISHENLCALFDSTLPVFRFSSKDKIACVHSVSFDFSVWEILSALLVGAELVIFSKDAIVNTTLFIEGLKTNRVTVLNQTPSSLYNLTSYLMWNKKNGIPLLSLRTIILGGEAVSPRFLDAWFNVFPLFFKTKIYNMYGITEGTIHSSIKLVDKKMVETNISNIGVPLRHVDFKVLDPQGEEVAVGSVGELFIGGRSIASGYLKKPQLSRERFIDGKWLRTGDLVRRLSRKEFEYISRVDRQISLRGYRIEVKAIENIVLEFSEVKAVRIEKVTFNEADNRLVCFIVAFERGGLLKKIKNHLKSKLPMYMMPAFFSFIDELPLTANGKINAQKLIDDFLADCNWSSAKKECPKNRVFNSVALAWQEVLGCGAVSGDVNFFDAGGHSLLLTHLQRRLENYLGIKISFLDLLTYPTINQFSKAIQKRT